MKKKILLCITSQFGYHTDTYMYCKYLDKTKYDVHYIGFDMGYGRRTVSEVKVNYVPVNKNIVKRYWLFLTTINHLIRKEKFDVVFLVQCQVTLMIRLCNPFQKTILDIRTGDVWLENNSFSKYNFQVWLTSLLFKNISIISLSLAKVLNLRADKCHYLPLGGEQMNLPSKTFESLNLFYIGTLHGRNLHQTIEGMAIFKTKNNNIPIHFHIVGSGSESDENLIVETINKNTLQDFVTLHGHKNHDEVKDLFTNSNLGVVYIPITYGYTCQPTTKLYEYLLAGMPVIATNTLENKLALKKEAGVLVDDNAKAFSEGLEEFWNERGTINTDKIKSLYSDSSWESIVKYILEPYFEKVLNS